MQPRKLGKALIGDFLRGRRLGRMYRGKHTMKHMTERTGRGGSMSEVVTRFKVCPSEF